jgi:hypothetical protein
VRARPQLLVGGSPLLRVAVERRAAAAGVSVFGGGRHGTLPAVRRSLAGGCRAAPSCGPSLRRLHTQRMPQRPAAVRSCSGFAC